MKTRTNTVRTVPASKLAPAALAAAALATAWGSAYAAGEAGTEAASSAALAAPNLQEVVVTARRREEPLMDVPLAATVKSGAVLQQQSAVLFADALQDIPNTLAFASARSVSALEISMRGQVALPSSIAYDPAVGLYIDGVYVANGQAAMGTLLDIDSVQVVRGTQGTLFGRNNTGGSILINSNRPDLNNYSAEVALSAGNQGLFGARTIINAPLSDSFGLRFAYQDNQHQGWGSSIVTGQDNMMDQHRYQARAGALWQPNQAFDAYLTFERFYANEGGGLLHPLPGTVAATIPGNIVPDDFYQTDAGKWVGDQAETNSWMLTLAAHASQALQAKLIAGYRELNDFNDYDADAMRSSIADVTLLSTSWQKSVELQLSGQTPGEQLDWVGGLYWFHDRGGSDSTLAPGLSAPEPTYDTNTVDNRSKAAYLHGEFKLTSQWSIAAGARYTDDDRQLIDNAYVDLSPLGPPQFCTIVDASAPGMPPLGAETGGPCPYIRKDVSYNYWSWDLSSSYHFNDELMGYVRAGRGQRSGGWNIPLNTLQDQPFSPEQLTDVELGVKANQLGGALTVTADVFTGYYDNLQRLLATFVGGTPTTIVINAGKAQVSGAEFEGALALSRALMLQATFGWTDARYITFIGPNGQDLSDNQFYMTPKFDASLAGIYGVALPAGDLHTRLDYSWRDSVEFNVINDFNRQGPVGLLNGRVWLTSLSGMVETAVFGTNLTDKRYAYIGGSILNPAGGPPVASWQAAADRRLMGVEVTYRLQSKR
jgi:iron complex outermembrane recepter protein